MLPFVLPYAVACALIVIVLMIAVRRKPDSVMNWSIIATVIQILCVPAAEIVSAGTQSQLVRSAASSVVLCSLLFPLVVWLNAPASASEPGIAYYASTAAVTVLAGGGIILAFDPFLAPHFAGSHPQLRLFRTEVYSVTSVLIAMFFISYCIMMVSRGRSSRSRAERRKLRVIAFHPLGYAGSAIGLAFVASDPLIYSFSIAVVSVVSALLLIRVVADPLVYQAVIPADIMYACVSVVLFACAFAVIDAAGSVLALGTGMSTPVGRGLIIAALGLLCWPLVLKAQKMFQRLFYKDMETIRSLFYEFTERARSMINIEAIAEAFCSYLEDAFMVSRSEIFLLDDGSAAYRCVQMHERSFSAKGSLPALCSMSPAPRAVAECIEMCSPDEQRILREYGNGTVIPIHYDGSIKGFLFVGPLVTGTIFHRGAAFRDVFTPAVQALSFIVDRHQLIEQLRRDEARFAQEDRLAILGTFGAGIAHELRNPLNVISTSAQTILRKAEDIDMHAEVAHFIVAEAARMSRTIDEFLRYSRSNVPEWRNEDIRTIIENALHSAQAKIEARRVIVHVKVMDGFARMVTSARHLEHALANIFLNATEAMDDGGVLTITVNDDGHDRIAIRIQDTGKGIPEALLEKIFDPFFTTKKDGTGLGLPIVRMILANIGASVTAGSNSRGAEFIVSMPVDGTAPYD